jgi:hypothetical protein
VPPASTPAFTPLPLPPNGLRPTDVPRVVGTVNGKPVPTWLYLSQVNFQLSVAESGSSGQPGEPVTRAQLRSIEQQSLVAVIEEMLLVDYGLAHGWAPTPQQEADSYQRVVQRRGGTAASLRQVASEYLTVDQDRTVATYHLITQQVLEHFVSGLHQPVAAASFRMIVTAGNAQSAQVRDMLARSGRWVDLAARYSIDSVGRNAGGEQPILERSGSADPALRAAIFGTPPQHLTGPIHLRGGWAVLEVLQAFPSQDLYRADLVRYQQWAENLRARARITAYISLPAVTP